MPNKWSRAFSSLADLGPAVVELHERREDRRIREARERQRQTVELEKLQRPYVQGGVLFTPDEQAPGGVRMQRLPEQLSGELGTAYQLFESGVWSGEQWEKYLQQRFSGYDDPAVRAIMAGEEEPRPGSQAPGTGATAPMAGPTRYRAMIEQEARQRGIDPRLLSSLIQQESGGDPWAVSPKGAMGLGQLMPGTAQELGVRDPFDPQQNVRGAARYLGQQLQRFGGDRGKALAAYNAGPGRVASGQPWPAETQQYVARVQGGAGAPDVRGIDRTIDELYGKVDRLHRLGSKAASAGIASLEKQIGLLQSRREQIHKRQVPSMPAMESALLGARGKTAETASPQDIRGAIAERQAMEIEKNRAIGASQAQTRPAPGKAVDEMTDLQKGIDLLNVLEEKYAPSMSGPVRGRLGGWGQTLGIGISDQESDFRVAAATYENMVTKIQSGTAVSGHEALRLARQVPLPTDPPQVLRSKVRLAREILENALTRGEEGLKSGGYGLTPKFTPRAPKSIEEQMEDAEKGW